MANNLNYIIIAEGVENEAQHEFLKECGCHYGQGFFFSKSLLAGKFMALLFEGSDHRKGIK